MVGFSVATWISFLLSFFSAPITTRLFVPDEMGRINLFTTFLNLFMMFAYLGLDQAYVRFYNEPPGKNNSRGVFTICTLCSVAFSVVLSAGILLFWNPVSTAITGNAGLIVPLLLSVSILANVLIRFFNLSARMQSKAMLYSVQTILVALAGKLFYVIVAFWNPTHVYAIGAMTLSYALIAVALIFVQTRNTFTRHVDASRGVMKTLFKFALPLLPVSLLSWLNNSVAQLLLKGYVSYAAIGIYTNAGNIANLVALIQAGFNAYWQPFVYENYKTGNSKIRKVHNLITVAMIAFGLAIVLGQDVIYLLLGEKYRAGKEFFPFLLLTPICYTIAETTGVGINIAKKSHLNIITFVANTGVNLLLCFLLLPRIGVVGAAIAAAASSIVMLIVKTILGEKYYPCVGSYLKTFTAVGIIAAAAVCNWLLYAVVWLKYGILVLLLAGLLLLYRREVAYLWTFGVEVLRDLVKKVRRKKD